MTRLLPYAADPACPKCGSHFLGGPVWHLRWSKTFFSSWLPFIHFCLGFALDHLHFRCSSCGHAWASACADVLSQVSQ